MNIIKKCKICKTELVKYWQTTYCSYSCRSQDRKNGKQIECLNCHIEFYISKCGVGKSKYCSRKCKDEYQKIIFSKEKNPNYGKRHPNMFIHTEEERMKISCEVTKHWQTEDRKEKHIEAQQRYKNKYGYMPIASPQAKINTKKTLIDKYGVEFSGQIDGMYEKSLKTCIERYGKSFICLMTDAKKLLKYRSINKPTIIEIKVRDLLIKNEIEYKEQFKIFFNEGNNYRVYDFFIPSKKLIIEADGDYWHANPMMFKQLNETQAKCVLNDVFKTNLAIVNGYNVIRFWETEIKETEFELKLLERLK